LEFPLIKLRFALLVAAAIIHFLLGSSAPSEAKRRRAEPEANTSCRNRELVVCNGASSNRPVCELIKSSSAETSVSIGDFFRKLEKLHQYKEMDAEDRRLRDDLICARLFGPKTFEKITFRPIWRTRAPSVKEEMEKIFSASERNQWRISEGSEFFGEYYLEEGGRDVWDVQFEGDLFRRIADNHKKLHSLNRDPGGTFSVSFKGFVDRVEFIYVKTYSGGRVYNPGSVKGIKIVVKDARVTWLRTSVGAGNSEQVLRLSSEALKKAYGEYMQ
jgi:hypothetical protein